MQIGTSIFLIAVGAILRFAVHASTTGFSIHTAGVILMVVGAVGLVVSLLLASMWAGRRGPVATERVVVRDREIL
jgi:hypothetical protein